jgi:hypothetical protein
MPTPRRTVRLSVATLTGLGVLAALGAQPAATAAGPKFGKPVLLTVDANAGGYEPGVVVDKFGNVVVTAHKQNHTLVVSPDKRSPTGVRSMSWIWWSADNGKSFADMPGLTAAAEQNAEFGDEGDLAWDNTGHVYFVDTNITDVSFSRWKASGHGELALETSRPVGPMAGPVDDRPWVAAHGDGVVMYLGNEGDRNYPAGKPTTGTPDAANGPGRFTAYMSYDHGDTFNNLGYTLKDSGWCRPMADKRPGSKTFYVVCANDKDTHYVFVTNDDGRHFSRYPMGNYVTSSWINGEVGPDGTVYAAYHERDSDGINHLMLYTSKTQGRTWKKTDVTGGKEGQIQYSWMAVSPNGTLGFAFYWTAGGKKDWQLWAGTAKPGQKVVYAKVAPGQKLVEDGGTPWGDFFQVAFGPDNKLNVVWTQNAAIAGASGLNSEIFYAKQL